ncbi:MAG: hypothetical protein VX589_17700 [Myxococcota bacterium]|nr:hypothetical protein [Myxococcota bacterium]
MKLLVRRLADHSVHNVQVGMLFDPLGHPIAEAFTLLRLGGRKDLQAIVIVQQVR